MKVCDRCHLNVDSDKSVCPFCGNTTFSNDDGGAKDHLTTVPARHVKAKHSKSASGMSTTVGMWLIIGAVCVGSLFGFLSHGCSSEPSKATTTTQQAAPTKTSVSHNDYKGKEKEVMNAVNIMFSDDNKFTPLYEGVIYEGADDTAIIYVNDNWNHVSDATKKDFVKAAYLTWASSAHNRDIDFKTDNFHVRFVIKPETTVATWDSLIGISVK